MIYASDKSEILMSTKGLKDDQITLENDKINDSVQGSTGMKPILFVDNTKIE